MPRQHHELAYPRLAGLINAEAILRRHRRVGTWILQFVVRRNGPFGSC
jgi:hypothetical protein